MHYRLPVAANGGTGKLAAALAWIPKWIVRASAALGPIGVLVGLVIGLQVLLNLHGPKWAVALAVGVCVLLLLAVVLVFVEQYLKSDALKRQADQHSGELEMYRRGAQVAASMPAFHEALHLLRDASFLAQAGDSEVAYFEVLQRSLAAMTTVFHTVTGEPCRMCVKELVASRDAPSDITLRTDDDERWFTVQTRYRHDGSQGAAKDAPTPLQLNTDFRSVWHAQPRQCFFSNDLDAEINYHNPHRQDPDNVDYSATIVWPIQKR
jgi:hypothetical protein